MHRHTSIFLYPSTYLHIYLPTYLSIYLWETYLLTRLQHLYRLLFAFKLLVKILFFKIRLFLFFPTRFNVVMFLSFNLVRFSVKCSYSAFVPPTSCLVLIEVGRVMRHITVVWRVRAIQNDILREMSLPLHCCSTHSIPSPFPLVHAAANRKYIEKFWLRSLAYYLDF